MKRLSLLVLLFALFIFPSKVLADVAPPINPPRSDLQSGAELTQLRMTAETVLIDVQSDTTPNSLVCAQTKAIMVF